MAEDEEIEDDAPSEDPDSEFPCTKCTCKEFVKGPISSVICRCGHDTKAHGLPF